MTFYFIVSAITLLVCAAGFLIATFLGAPSAGLFAGVCLLVGLVLSEGVFNLLGSQDDTDGASN
jgi:hypothetical protein